MKTLVEFINEARRANKAVEIIPTNANEELELILKELSSKKNYKKSSYGKDYPGGPTNYRFYYGKPVSFLADYVGVDGDEFSILVIADKFGIKQVIMGFLKNDRTIASVDFMNPDTKIISKTPDGKYLPAKRVGWTSNFGLTKEDCDKYNDKTPEKYVVDIIIPFIEKVELIKDAFSKFA